MKITRILTNIYEVVIGIMSIVSIIGYGCGMLMAILMMINAGSVANEVDGELAAGIGMSVSFIMMLSLTVAEFIILALLGAAAALIDVRNINLAKARLDYPDEKL